MQCPNWLSHNAWQGTWLSKHIGCGSQTRIHWICSVSSVTFTVYSCRCKNKKMSIWMNKDTFSYFQKWIKINMKSNLHNKKNPKTLLLGERPLIQLWLTFTSEVNRLRHHIGFFLASDPSQSLLVVSGCLRV